MVQFIGAIVVIVGIITWIGANPVTLPDSEQVQELGAAAAAPAYFDETGMVVIEKTGSDQGVPWIVYQSPNRPIATKQLVFEGVERCDAGTRELPCASDTETGGYPVAAEQRVRIQGIIDGEKVLVQRISYL